MDFLYLGDSGTYSWNGFDIDVIHGHRYDLTYTKDAEEQITSVTCTDLNNNIATSSIAIKDILDSKTYFEITSINLLQSISSLTPYTIQAIDIDNEFTLINQAWNTTVEVKNFYWLNAETYLEETDSNLTIYEKLQDLDDWKGDKFKKVSSIKRSLIVPSEILKHGVCSTYGDTATAEPDGAIFWTIEILSHNQFRFNFYKPLSENEWTSPIEKTIKINTVSLGLPLVANYQKPILNSYKELTAYEVVHESKITCTHVGSKVIFAFHMDNALSQWTLIFNYSDMHFDHVIHGMGYVGLDGSLTGGEWPDEFFDSDIGFSGSIQPIDNLQNFKTKDIESFTKYGCYGNTVQQWYITQKITQVVSHMTFDSATNMHSAKYIPLENSYTARYESTSFYINKLTGFIPQTTTLTQILPFNISGLNTTLAKIIDIASPTIWYMTPTWTKMGFLQQSLGQYAYVYQTTAEMNTGVNPELYKNRDSSSTQNEVLQQGYSPKEGLKAFDHNDAILARDALSFDKQEIEQIIDESESSQASLGGFWLAIMTQGIAMISQGVRNAVQINATQNQTTGLKDKAKAFTQFAIENALTAASTDIGMSTSNNISLASKVTAVKTLDMFYSTTAHNNGYAGSGYVCHQFVGQCIAQSVSNRFIQGNQYGMFTVIYPLTTIPLLLINISLEAAKTALNTVIDGALKGATYNGALIMSTGAWSSLPAIAAGAIQGALVLAADLVINYNKFWIENLPKIVESFAPKGPQFYNSGNISSHNIDIEAKHKYGNKHCVFMWPCFNAISTSFTNESVFATNKDTTTYINLKDLPLNTVANLYASSEGTRDMSTGVTITNVTDNINKTFAENLKGNITSRYIYCQGSSTEYHNLPADMTVIEGATTFLPSTPFKNENIDATVAFPVAPIHDFMIDNTWQIGVTAGQAGIIWTSIKDTKVIDGECSNMFVNNDVCLLASSYCTLEVKQGIDKDYIRPIAYTPTTLAWNITGYNLCNNDEIYHAFDGIGYRITEWHGSSGMDVEQLAFVYNFQENEHLKRSNILPPNQFFGNFRSLPNISVEAFDPVYLQVEIDAWGIGTSNDSPYEDRTQTRYSVPIFIEPIATLPAVVKALSSYKLDVYDGVTGLTTDIRTTQNAYKAPESIDFSINKQVFRSTHEYICLINEQGLSAGDVVAKLGMQFIGATPEKAFFYSPETRAYYAFTGNATITKQDVWNRFKDIKSGKWDFVNQEVVFECLGNMTRLYDDTLDTDDFNIDNLLIAHLGDKGIDGDITPPNETIFDGKLQSQGGSWFKTYSFAGGLTYQGPNRFIVNRFICLDYMLEDILANRGKWTRVSKDKFYPFRKYPETFTDVETRIEEGIKGWTHNPFLLCTSPMGVDKDTDCMFEWELVFTWTDEMDKLYGKNSYACVNIMAQTMCPGGKKRSAITHVYLKKDLFTRNENTGYYSLRFQSKNGAGNREQLFIWSDAYIAMTNLQLEYKVITSKRQTPLAVSNIAIKEMEEF